VFAAGAPYMGKGVRHFTLNSLKKYRRQVASPSEKVMWWGCDFGSQSADAVFWVSGRGHFVKHTRTTERRAAAHSDTEQRGAPNRRLQGHLADNGLGKGQACGVRKTGGDILHP